MFPDAIKRYALLSGAQELAVGISKRSRHEDIDEGAFLRSDGSTSASESVVVATSIERRFYRKVLWQGSNSAIRISTRRVKIRSRGLYEITRLAT